MNRRREAGTARGGAVRAAVVLACVAALAAGGACAGKKKRGGPATDGLTGGVLVFADDFQRESLGDQWQARSGKWTLVDGGLHVQGDRNEGAWLTVALPDRVRVEFDARSANAEGDIKCEIFASESRHQTGYIAILGGWKNAMSVLARLDEHGEDRMESDAKVTIGQVHRFVLVRTEGALRWYVDGNLVLAFPDDEPLRGRYFGFNNWNSDVTFDNLAVYRL